MAIIGISGKIGAGKDAVGTIIQYLTTKEAGVHTLKDLTEPRLTYQEFLEKFRTPYTIDSNWEIKKFAGKLKQIVALLTGCTVENLESQEFKSKLLSAEWNYVNKYIKGDNSTHGNFPLNVDTYKDDEIFKATPDRFTKLYSYRDLLQKVGTEAMRNCIHENVWVNALFADYGYYTRNTVEGNAEYDGEKNKYVIKAVPLPELEHLIGTEVSTPKWRKLIPEREECPNWVITDMRFPNELKAVKDNDGITIRLSRTQFHTVDSLKTSEHPSETALDDATFDYVIDNNGTIEELIYKVREILTIEKII